MPINPGKLDRLIQLQAFTTERDSGGGVISEWRNVGQPLAAEKLSEASREFRSAAATRIRLNYLFRVRYRAGITEKHRLIYNGRACDIVSVEEEGRREFLLLASTYSEGAAP